MRLSDVLNKAPKTDKLQIENFLGSRRIAWGKSKKVEVGRVVHNFYCLDCGDVRTFQSDLTLTCLIAGHNLVSIDVALQCPVCSSSVEAWYLVASDDDLYAYNPIVYLDRYTENRREAARGVGTGAGEFEEWLDQAQLAYEHRLGAGSMIYLRKIFESVTTGVALATGISTQRPNGSRKPFKELLREVDGEHCIIPLSFSSNGYTLFSELSEVIHGDSSEEEALRKYLPCRQLVVSVVKKVSDDQDIAGAISALGWDVSGLERISGMEVLS